MWCHSPAHHGDPRCPEAPLAVAASTQTTLCDRWGPPSAVRERRTSTMEVVVSAVLRARRA